MSDLLILVHLEKGTHEEILPPEQVALRYGRKGRGDHRTVYLCDAYSVFRMESSHRKKTPRRLQRLWKRVWKDVIREFPRNQIVLHNLATPNIQIKVGYLRKSKL